MRLLGVEKLKQECEKMERRGKKGRKKGEEREKQLYLFRGQTTLGVKDSAPTDDG